MPGNKANTSRMDLFDDIVAPPDAMSSKKADVGVQYSSSEESDNQGENLIK